MYTRMQLTENIQLNLIRPIEYIQDNTRDAKCLLRVLKNEKLMTDINYHKKLMTDALKLESPKEHKIACFFNSIVCIDRNAERNNLILNKIKDFINSTLAFFEVDFGDNTSINSSIVLHNTALSIEVVKEILQENDQILLHLYLKEQFREFIIILEKHLKGYQLCSYNLRHNIMTKGFYIEKESKKIIRDNLTENNIIVMLNNLNDALKYL